MAEPKSKLPADVIDELNKLLSAAGEATRAGDCSIGIELAQRAWEIIPEPKEA